MTIRATVIEQAAPASGPVTPIPPSTALALTASVNTESASNGDKETAGKAKKPRAKARKPKAVTLAEMKSLTGGADRAVVWSQVGPGKFVRQPGEENGDSDGEEFQENGPISSPAGMVIEAVATSSSVMDDSEEMDD